MTDTTFDAQAIFQRAFDRNQHAIPLGAGDDVLGMQDFRASAGLFVQFVRQFAADFLAPARQARARIIEARFRSSPVET